jgi:hypothetical protein
MDKALHKTPSLFLSVIEQLAFCKINDTSYKIKNSPIPEIWVTKTKTPKKMNSSVFAIVILSVDLRQKGSAQSTQADAPNAETGGYVKY